MPPLNALLNSYSVLFFSNNRLFSVLLLLVSFFNPYSGVAGLLAAVLAIGFSHFTGLNKGFIEKGTYSYNALIIGIGLGATFNFSGAFWLLLTIVSIFSVVLSVILQSFLGKYKLPFLTIPFVICFWIVLLVSRDFAAISFTFRNVFWLNNLYAAGDQELVRLVMFMERLNLPPLVSTFFRALSSLYFQNNILAGVLIATGILIHSRIIFSLLVIGFITAFLYNSVVMAHPEGMNYYLMGGNYILVSVAIGGFFVVPSLYSYLWAILSVPITFLMVTALGSISGEWNLPVYSMPFSITVLLLLYFFSLKAKTGGMVLTPFQFFSPEKNLYNYLNNKKRLVHAGRIRLQLPFIGQWMVSQGYDGGITHKGDWSKALDFIIVDHELKTFKQYAAEPEDFYCYGKPVVAPADGFVQLIEDHIEDNAIGRVNQKQNWGNSIVIKHAEGFYSKMSHLRRHSFKVKAGDFVKQGEIVAACGNSGRSPEPHLHFQLQTTPHIGSKTLAFPLANYLTLHNGKFNFHEFAIPGETDLVQNIIPDLGLKKAFGFLPGFNLNVKAEGLPEANWEVLTDAFNQSYFYCHQSKSIAYFHQNETEFYFSAFEGNKNSLLYHFYLACYKIYFFSTPQLTAKDMFPLQLSKSNPAKWLQDLFAPFFIFSRLHYESMNQLTSADFLNTAVSIHSRQVHEFLTRRKTINEFTIEVNDDKISNFTFLLNQKKYKAVCTPKGY